eukprot:m.98761 g.98761  ORF g.98761 m.98761 type:complete len:225 (-) comp27094_c0_seq1:84-758(-)
MINHDRLTSIALVVICLQILNVSALKVTSDNSPKVVVVYHSETNFTKMLGQLIASGATEAGAQVRLLSVTDCNFSSDVLEWADGFILGSPTHYGNPSATLLQWVESDWETFWTDDRLPNKVGAVFATGGGLSQGVEHVLSGLTRLLWSFRIQVVVPDPTRSGFSSYGAVAVTGTAPFNTTKSIAQQFVGPASNLGKDVVKQIMNSKNTSSKHLQTPLSATGWRV